MDDVKYSSDSARQDMQNILDFLRKEKESAGNSEKGRAISVALTQLEIASMCMIRSFFADVPYSPMNKLKPATE